MSDLGFPVFETARQPLQLGSILGWDFLDPRPIYLLNTINALFSFLFFFSFSFLSFFQLILAGKTLFTFFLSVFLSLSLFLSLFLSLSLSLSELNWTHPRLSLLILNSLGLSKILCGFYNCFFVLFLFCFCFVRFLLFISFVFILILLL